MSYVCRYVNFAASSEMEYMRIKELKSYQKKISIKTNVATDEDNG